MNHEAIDRLEIAELAQFERLARDAQRWDELAACYRDDEARVYLSWFDGTVADFIEASRRMAEEPGGHAGHFNAPSIVRVAGDRAVVETPCAILFRLTFAGVECDMTAYCRHHSRVQRVEGRWRLASFVGVYEKNVLAPVIPGAVPSIDAATLKGFRRSYAYQAYFRAQEGKAVHDDRPGVDRPDLVARFLDAENTWLGGADIPLGVGSR